MKNIICFALLTATAAGPMANAGTTNAPDLIPWSKLGAKAGVDYHGDGLAVSPTESGARLHCVFQRLDGEATPEGLWLSSTVTNTLKDRFRVTATGVRRVTQCAPEQRAEPSTLNPHLPILPRTGRVSIDGQTVQFSRPGLTEEYSVNMDGVQQDFVLTRRPGGNGALRVELKVDGARAEAVSDGARLVLSGSGRKLTYNRLQATDSQGRALTARLEVVVPDRLAVVVEDGDALYPVRIDPTFSDANWIGLGGLPGTDFQVNATVVDGSGNLYIGGTFTIAGNTKVTHVAKWNGSSWSALGSGFNGYVYALAASGSTLFVASDGGVVQWDGTNWLALGSGLDGAVYALAVSGGTLYAGGDFTQAGADYVNYIAQWDGTNWSAMGWLGMNGDVYALAVSGDTLYAGGRFSTAGGIAANLVAQWDGSAWSALGSGISGNSASVHALAVSGGTLYAGGGFSSAGGVAATNIAQWNGSSWSALGSGMNGGVEALAVSSGTLYAGGGSIAQWDGTNWSPLGPVATILGSGVGSGQVYTLAVSGGMLYAGGYFRGTAAANIAQWDGTNWSALLGSGLSSPVSALAVSGGTLYVGTLASYVARWNGSSWSALGSGMNGGVGALAVAGGTLYAGGGFTTAGGTNANYIAQWNGSSWSAVGSGMNGGVGALAVAGGTLYAGGNFTTAGGIAANYIAQWNGSSWSPLGSGMGGGAYTSVYALAVSGGTLYTGGHFTTAGGSQATNIAQWNGSSWSALGSGMGGGYPYAPDVYALAVAGDTLYAGGGFTTAGGNAANFIAQWNGSSWSPLGSGMAYAGYPRSVSALAVAGGTLYAGGYFTNAGGVAANYIAQWNGSSWSPLGSGMNVGVIALAVAGGTLYAGGVFTTAGTNVSAYAAEAILNPGNWLTLQAGVPGPGTNTLTYLGLPPSQYVAQYATNLTTSPWFPLATNTPGAYGVGTLLDTTATDPQRFYRLSGE